VIGHREICTLLDTESNNFESYNVKCIIVLFSIVSCIVLNRLKIR
jgi:hypothetical protein